MLPIDLACAGLARLRARETHDVRFVIRLQHNWKPKMGDIAHGEMGVDLSIKLDNSVHRLPTGAVDRQSWINDEAGNANPLREIIIVTVPLLPPRIRF